MSTLGPPKQVILVRRDLRLKRAEAAAAVAKVSASFMVDLLSKEPPLALSVEESDWFFGDGKRIVLGVQSENAALSLMSRASIEGLTVFPLYRSVSDDDKSEWQNELIAVAIGPHDEDTIDELTARLKLF